MFSPVVSESPQDDDKLLSDLRRAANFMQAARVRQAESEKRFMGQSFLSDEQENAIIQAAGNSALVKAVKDDAQMDGAVNYLAERFEEMCRRIGFSIDRQPHSKEQREAVVKLLATELFVNQKALNGLSAEELIPLTVRLGAVGPEFKKEFPQFERAQGVFEYAAKSNPGDPRSRLHEVVKRIETLAQDPEFERLRETPEIFRIAVVMHGNSSENARAFLRHELGNGKNWQTAVMEKREDGKDPAGPQLP